MTIHLRQQMWTGGRARAARAAADNRRSALVGARQQGGGAQVRAANLPKNSAGLHGSATFLFRCARGFPWRVHRRPIPVVLIPRRCGSVASPFLGPGAVIRCRPLQFLRIGEQVRQDQANPPKTHQHILSSAVVAVEANHDWERFSRAQIPFVSGAKSV